MDIRKFKMYLKGEGSPEELKEFRDWLGSNASREQLSDLINNIDEKELLKNEKLLESFLWKKISERLEVEEIISSISSEHRKQEKRFGKNRAPIWGRINPRRKRWTSGILTALLLVSVFSAVILNNFYTKDQATLADLVEKSTEKGQKLTLHLSDGTKVTLNSNSSIAFPRIFEDSTREVNVKGEVFFDVAHNKNKPFIVHAGTVSVRVLGTSFNFQYFPEENFKKISLVSGKVQVNINGQNLRFKSDSNYILEPGEEIRIDKKEGKVVKSLFDVERVTSWKNGTLFYKYASFEEVVQRLENWYGVDINVTGKPAYKWKLTARFTNENLENVLQSLSHSQGIQYSINGKNVTIKF